MTGNVRRMAAWIICAGLVLCAIPATVPAQQDCFVAHRLTALASIRFMPEALAGLFRQEVDQYVVSAVAPGVSWPRDDELRRRNLWHHVDADAGLERQTREARLGAFRKLPHDEGSALRWFRRHGPTAGGELPWAIARCRVELVAAFRSADRAAIVAAAGHLSHFVADATNPFRCSVNASGSLTGNARFGALHGIHPRSPDHSIRERFGAGLPGRYLTEYTVETEASTAEPGSPFDPLTSIFELIEGSLAVLDDVANADREILDELGVTDGGQFAERVDVYYARLHERCGAIRIGRLRAGAALASSLIAEAWRSSGAPGMEVGRTIDEASRWVASQHSDVFHRSGCPFVDLIKPENLVAFGSRREAREAGRRPCQHCLPS